MPKISLLIAAYNEEKSIESCLKRVVSRNIGKWQKEIIVVNDGSTDRTKNIINDFQKKKYPIKIVEESTNKGKGNAIRKAIKIATGDILIIQDADLEYDPVDIKKILKKFDNRKIDVVYGSRILGERLFENSSSHLFFYLGGRSLTLIMNTLFGTKLTDQPTCYKAWRRNFSKDILKRCKQNGFEFEVELTAFFAKSNLIIEEVPIRYYPRNVNLGKKVNLMDFFKSLFIAFKCYFF
ncbi:MAG: glycosyltransferase family 2 protein [Patescibacteria group bacterium]